MIDLFEKLEQNTGGPLRQHASKGAEYYFFPKLEGELGSRMMFKGKERIIWSVNNYLGMANMPEIRQVDAEAAAKWGAAYPMGSRMMSGNSEFHVELEEKLAAFVNKEDAILLNFGYQGIMSAIDALVDRRDVIVYDSESHACILDGVRLHQGKRFVFQHNDMESCEKQLQRATDLIGEKGGSILVISEGVFGMGGDQGKLKEIVALKEKYNFRLMVDDAHGFGTLGATGAGAGEEQGVQDGIDVYFATFAKSMASVGAFIASKKYVTEHLRYTVRSQIFAKSLPMIFVEGALKRLELLKARPDLKDKLWANVNMLQSGLKQLGFNLGATNSCVTPVYLEGGADEATKLIYDLRENYGIFCSVVVYPVIPKGQMLLRLIPTAAHTEQDIKETLEAFAAIFDKLKTGVYADMEVDMETVFG